MAVDRDKYLARQARYYTKVAQATKELHAWLVELLGGVCVLCAYQRRLEIDHPNGRTWQVEKLAFKTRVERYWQEYWDGVKLRVLCRKCNAQNQPKYTRDDENVPF